MIPQAKIDRAPVLRIAHNTDRIDLHEWDLAEKTSAADRSVVNYENFFFGTKRTAFGTFDAFSGLHLGFRALHPDVRISESYSVTRIVCSNCALRCPSAVTAVHRSSHSLCCHPPILIIGLMVKIMPGSILAVASLLKKWET